MKFTDDDLKRFKTALDDWSMQGTAARAMFGNLGNRLLARLEAAESCADALDANYATIIENSDEDDVYIVDQCLIAWRKAAGK